MKIKYFTVVMFSKSNNIWVQLFRYCFVAVGAFAVDYGCYAFILFACGLQWYLWANVAGFILGTLANYVIAKLIVFQGKPKSRTGEIALVFVIGGIGLFLQQVGLYWLTDVCFLHPLLSKLLMTAICFFWNFFARKFFMYSKYFNIIKD